MQGMKLVKTKKGVGNWVLGFGNFVSVINWQIDKR